MLQLPHFEPGHTHTRTAHCDALRKQFQCTQFQTVYEYSDDPKDMYPR